MRHATKIRFGLFGLVIALLTGCSQSKPQEITIAYSNNMHGEIRSCGCGEHDYGGLGRRATFVDGVRNRSKNFLLFEAGDFFGLDLNYGEQKARLTMQAVAFMRYSGIVIGEKDFALGVDYVKERVASLKLPVVAANLIDTQTGGLLFAPSRIEETDGGIRVGIIGVVGPGLEFPEAVTEGRLQIGSPKAAIERELAAMTDVDIVVLLAHMPMARAKRMVAELPAIDMTIVGHDARPLRKVSKFGNAYVLSTADRGRVIGLAWGTYDAKTGLGELNTNVSVLTEEIPDHEAIVKLFRSYDVEIARIESAGVSTGVPKGEYAKSAYAGSDACAPCHAEIHAKWETTQHAHAFATLESQDRHLDRDCTPCHTTGFYEMGGFLSLSETPNLTNVQCEACHGNGKAHSKNPEIETPRAAKGVCISCHTKEQTPSFTFDGHWPAIAH